MAFSTSPPVAVPTSPHSLFAANHHQLPLKQSSKVRTHVVFSNPTSQKPNFLDSNHTHFHKSDIKSGFPKNQPVTNVSTADELVRGYTQNDLFEDAIKLYLDISKSSLPVEELTCFPFLIKGVGELGELNLGKQIHGHVLKLGFLDDIYVLNSLLAMYFKCDTVNDYAMCLFEEMTQRDSVSWNTMISGFNQSRQHGESFAMFRRMVCEFGVSPNRVACCSALSTCGSNGYLIHGREIHAFVIKNGLDTEPILVNGLIGMYTKCRHLRNAENIFKKGLEEGVSRDNPVIWNAMIHSYVKCGLLFEGLVLFQEMVVLGVEPDYSTMLPVLVLCSQLSNLETGRQIHSYLIRFGLEKDTRVETALLDMYGKCGDIKAGLRVFEKSCKRNHVMWGAVITGCAQNGFLMKAFELFAKFRLEGGVPDSMTIVSMLRACSLSTLKLEGMFIHGLSIKMALDSDTFIGGALIDMYSKCGDIESAEKKFFLLPRRDNVSWNGLLSGYAKNNCMDKALNAFRDMQLEHLKPNTVTISQILTICAQLSLLIFCKQIHAYLIRNSFDTNVLVRNSLIATYAKCGEISSAWYMFNTMPERNDISWNSMILAVGIHGRIDDMFSLFDKMIAASVKPDHVTFTAILSACSHAGRLEEGWECFRRMVEEYEIKPELEQYTCMVDLLGRAGHLTEAYDLIRTMPPKPDTRIWGSLLGSCKIHRNKQMAECVANHIFELDASSIGYHVLLSNIYEDFGEWDDVTRTRGVMKDMALQKFPGCSWIEVNNRMHVFVAGDRSHDQSEELYCFLANLTGEMKRTGYMPQLSTTAFWS